MASRTVIFVHGLGLSGEVWKPLQSWCTRHNLRSIAITLPGHGSRRDHSQISTEAMVAEIIDTTRRYNKVILIAHSFGALLCARAMPHLTTVESALFINPLTHVGQLRPLFFFALRIAQVWQGLFGVGKPGNYAGGTAAFWRYGIYPYCLFHNPAHALRNLLDQEKRQEEPGSSWRVSPLIKVVTSCWDELLVPAHSDEVVPISGHMLFRLDPSVVTDFLRSALSRAQRRA